MEKLKIYAKTIEEEAKEMVYSLAKHEAFKNSQLEKKFHSVSISTLTAR